MAKVSENHSGYRASGIYKKYLNPAIVEKNKTKSKKDTVKWCGGKKGKEHQLIRYFHRPWLNFSTQSKYKYVKCKCQICGKQFSRKKDISIPLMIDLDNRYEHSITYQIQVKVDGVALPFKEILVDYRDRDGYYSSYWDIKEAMIKNKTIEYLKQKGIK